MPDLRLFLPKQTPAPLIGVVVIGFFASLVPLAAIINYTQKKHPDPRIHLFQDMDNQPKLKAQHESPIFADGRTMRQPVAGTVARGDLHESDHLYLGYQVKVEDGNAVPEYLPGFPEEIDVDPFFLAHGQEKFDTFCFPCHGKAGYGDGPVNNRAMSLAAGDATLSKGTVWTRAANFNELVDGKLRFGEDAYPNGQIFNTITHGKATMAGYGHAIPVEDRWAIVAYIRALQMSQNVEAAQQAATDAASLNHGRLARLEPNEPAPQTVGTAAPPAP